jgi:hypothetical protein
MTRTGFFQAGYPEKSDIGKYAQARDGDDLMVSFECDLCMFWKLYGRPPSPVSETDTFSLACIRRVNLDAFWSRARSTVEANSAKVREGLKISARLGLPGPYLDPGPLPAHDHCGYEVALQIVVSSLESGRYSTGHKQWDTIRRFRSCYSNQVRAARDANCTPLVLADNKGSGFQKTGHRPMWLAMVSKVHAGVQQAHGSRLEAKPGNRHQNYALSLWRESRLELEELRRLTSGTNGSWLELTFASVLCSL